MAAAAFAPVAPRLDARQAVQGLLGSDRGFAALDHSTRQTIAGSLARIGSASLDYHEAAEGRAGPGGRERSAAPTARAFNAGQEFSGVATDRVARTTRDIMNAVSFPRFVNELITGVFKAMNDSQQQQLTAFVELIRNVAQTTEGFADSNVGVSGARSWLAEHFPTSYMIEGGEEVDVASELEGLDPAEARERRAEIQAEQDAATRLIMRPGGSPPSEAALRAALGADEGIPLPASNPEALVPLARQVLARNRQQLLATMIQMGLQRIVIESGRINAAMRLHVDASSVAENDRGSQFDTRTNMEVGGGARFGPWGMEAKVQSTIGYVSTERTQTTESINSSVDLDSGVELVFRTDYVPLNRLAGGGDMERIRVNTINPEAEAERLTAQANERAATARTRSAERAARIDGAFRPPPDAPAGTVATARFVPPGPAAPARPATPAAPATTPATPAAPATTPATPAGPAAPATTPATSAAPTAPATTPVTPAAPAGPVTPSAPAASSDVRGSGGSSGRTAQ